MYKYPFKSAELAFSVAGFHTAYELKWDEHFLTLGEQHDFWELVCILEGEVEVAEDEHVYRLREGDVIFHAPMEFHKIRSLPGSSPHILILTFSHKGDMPSELSEGVFSLTMSEQSQLHLLVKSVIKMLHSRNAKKPELQISALKLSEFIIKLTSAQRPGVKFSLSRSAGEYHNIVVTMSEGVRQNLSLSEIAARCHISISYIKTLFSRYSGISPKSYYAKMRFNEAVKLLEEGYSVSEVSEMMNFSSPNYFSVFFKEHGGVSPAKYLKNK